MKGSTILSESILTGFSIVISFILIVLVVRVVLTQQSKETYKNLFESIGRDIVVIIDKLSSTTGSSLIEYKIPKGVHINLKIDYKTVFVLVGNVSVKKSFSGNLNSGPYDFYEPEVLCFVKSKYDNEIVIVDKECSCDIKSGICDTITTTTITTTTTFTTTTIPIPFIPNICDPEELNVNLFPPPGQGIFQCHSDTYIDKDFVSGGHLMLNWVDIEPEEGEFDFSRVDAFLNRLKSSHKRGELIFITYKSYGDVRGSPDWLYEKGAKSVNLGGASGILPVPWDPIYQEYLEKILRELDKKLREDDPCKLIQDIWISAGGPWGGVSIYTTNPSRQSAWLKSLNPDYDMSNTGDRRNFAKTYSQGVRDIIDIYMETILDRPVSLINPVAGGLTADDIDSLGSYSGDAVKTYGGRLYVKEAGVGLGNDCGVKVHMARFCKSTKGSWPWNCDFDECPATRCLYEPHGTLAQFQQYDCDYGYSYIGESLDGQKRYGDCAISTKGSMFCIYSLDLRDPTLEPTHQKLHSYAGSHIKVLSTGLETTSVGGKISFNLELSGNLPPFIFEREGIKDVPRSMKIKIYLKENDEFTDIGYFEPSPSSLAWREANYRYPNLASAEVEFEIPESIQSGSYHVYVAFHNPTYYYNWPVTGVSMDDYHRFDVGDINIE